MKYLQSLRREALVAFAIGGVPILAALVFGGLQSLKTKLEYWLPEEFSVLCLAVSAAFATFMLLAHRTYPKHIAEEKTLHWVLVEVHVSLLSLFGFCAGSILTVVVLGVFSYGIDPASFVILSFFGLASLFLCVAYSWLAEALREPPIAS